MTTTTPEETTTMTTHTATPTPGKVFEHRGAYCPAADPESYPLRSWCARCGAPVQCADGTADWGHTGGDTIDLDLVADALTAAGTPAYVEQTGGGCATIYVGAPVVCTQTGDEFHPYAVGPGWFHPVGPRLHGFGHVSDLYMGPNDAGDAPTVSLTTTDVEAARDAILAMIATNDAPTVSPWA